MADKMHPDYDYEQKNISHALFMKNDANKDGRLDLVEWVNFRVELHETEKKRYGDHEIHTTEDFKWLYSIIDKFSEGKKGIDWEDYCNFIEVSKATGAMICDESDQESENTMSSDDED